VDPLDESALTEALRAAADDRGTLRRRGLDRAARYTWQRAAVETWQVYEAATARG
jgi:glycosyltransferase involved in cell wall biosynthesis